MMPADADIACQKTDPWPFEQLIEERAGHTGRLALKLAVDICDTCDYRRECLLEENADEDWSKAIVGAMKLRGRKRAS